MFEINDKVVCVKEIHPVTKGNIYTVKDVSYCEQFGIKIKLVGVGLPHPNNGTFLDINWHNPLEYFRKIVPESQRVTEYNTVFV